MKREARAHIVRCHHDSGSNKAVFLLHLLRFKVSNRQGLVKKADLHGDTLCLRPVTLQYGVVRLMDFAILQSGSNLPDVL